MGISGEQLQRKRKKVGRQAYKKFTNEEDSDSEIDPKQDYGSQKETNVQEVISQGNISQPKAKNQNTKYGYDQGEGQLKGQIINPFNERSQVRNGVPQQHGRYEGGYQQDVQKKDTTGIPGKEQFYKDEQTVVKSQPTEMPLSTEVSLKTYLMSILHMPRSLQVKNM